MTYFDWFSTKARTSKIGDTLVIYEITSSGAEIISLRTPASKRGQGSARKALGAFCREADSRGLPVTLMASPLDQRTKLGRLVTFYRSMGFEVTGQAGNQAGDPMMVRPPVPL